MDSGVVLAAFGCWVLAAFGGGELLNISIPKLRPLGFLLSMACPCLCNDDIKSKHADNRHTRDRRKTRGLSVGIAIANSSPPPKAANTQQPKVANTIPEYTCPTHLSTPAPETSRKVSTVEAACPQPPPFQPPSLSPPSFHNV